MEIQIKDIKGKDIGKLSLSDEAAEILRVTGVELVVVYDPNKEDAEAYLR